MKARLTILTTTAVLAISGPAAQGAGAAIPWDTQSGGSSGGRALQSAGGCLPGATKSPRILAVIREGYSWQGYVHSYDSTRNVRTDAFDRREGAPLLWRRGSYHPGAYVPGGASIDVAKAIQAAGKRGPGGEGAPLLWRRGSYHPGAYVPGGAPIDVAKAIQAVGQKGPGGVRALQSGKDTEFRYAR
jgi:hypothetical protein